MRAVLPDINEVGRSKPRAEKRPCQSCSSMKNTKKLKGKHSSEIYQINKTFNCNSKMVVYLKKCHACGKQYNGSFATKFHARAYNYKSTHRNFRKEQKPSNQDFCD